MPKVPDNARKTRGQYPFPSPFEVTEDDNPEHLPGPDTSIPARFPPRGHVKNATEHFDEAAWSYSETRRTRKV